MFRFFFFFLGEGDSITYAKHYSDISVELIANLQECIALYEYIKIHGKTPGLLLRK